LFIDILGGGIKLRTFGLITFNNPAYNIAELSVEEIIEVDIWVLECLVRAKFKVGRATRQTQEQTLNKKIEHRQRAQNNDNGVLTRYLSACT
jgi:hypothetical protein